MKRNILLSISAAATLVFSSCSGFLNVDNLGKSTIESFFSDIDGMKAAGVGLHKTILDFYDGYYLASPTSAATLRRPHELIVMKRC